MLTRLIDWLVGCWTCDNCTWFSLIASVVSCVIRAVIIVALMYAVYRLGGDLINALPYTG